MKIDNVDEILEKAVEEIKTDIEEDRDKDIHLLELWTFNMGLLKVKDLSLLLFFVLFLILPFT